MSKIKNILSQLNVIKSPNENNKVINLTEIPKKEKKNQMPTTLNGGTNLTHQADLLFLPNDDGYRYLLVAVDIGTRIIDAEPLKSKDSKVVRDALKKIYKRKIIKAPLRLEVDDGTEFKGDFKKHWNKVLKIFTKLAGRHRSQAVVESKNGTIGEILNKAMLNDEIANDATSRKWVYLIPDVVKLINENFAVIPKPTPVDKPIRTNKYTENLLSEGTKVRYQLDNPEDYVEGQRLHGRFRKGDIRWSRSTHTIVQISLRPSQPPMYLLSNMPVQVAFTKYQLQPVSDDEVVNKRDAREQYAQRIISKKKEKGKTFYEVEWEDKTTSFEPRTQLIKEIPDMIRDFEKSKK